VKAKPVKARPSAAALLRAGVSLALIAVLVVVAVRQHVLQSVRAVPASAVIEAALAVGVAWVINSFRWKLLLRVAGVNEPAGRLISLYFLGMFFSQLLPTGAGGDAVRMWELYRRGHRPAAVVVATLQERLLGMGVSMLVGLFTAVLYFGRLPAHQRLFLLGAPAAAVIAVSFALYPRLLLSILGPRKEGHMLHRLTAAFRQAAELPPLTLPRLVPIVAVTLAGVLLSILAWYLLGRGAQVPVEYGGFCLVVPLVWIISMLPSLGGAGVREGGFVVLMKLFGVAEKTSLAVAALYLFIQLAMSGIGGLILLARMLGGSWRGRPPGIEPAAA